MAKVQQAANYMKITIRRGVPADARLLADLAARTFRDTFAEENRPEDMALHVSRAFGVPQQEAELARPEMTTLLAEVDGQPAGYAQLRTNAGPDCVRGARPLELWRFYVAAPWQGRGVAQALMTGVETEARAREAQTLWLGVWERNERAKSFYRKCGFADVGSQVFVLGTDAQTDRIMVRSLARLAMVARIWHGRTRARDYDAYWTFLRDRAIPDYRSTPGNRGVRLFRRLDGEVAHFLTLSYWESLEAIRAFAGADISVAKYYPEDREYLLEFEPSVQHYEVTDGDAPG